MHGSDRCFRKFVNAGNFYKADVIILGGDITGKMIVPIVEHSSNSFTAHFLGVNYNLKTQDELHNLEKTIRDSGYYPYRTTPKELEELGANKPKLDELFSRLMIESVKNWVTICEENLKGKSVKCFISPGNDDSLAIDPILRSSENIIDPEGSVINLDEHHEMISTGYSNITPFNCPRDISEDELNEKIEKMASQVSDMNNCIFNFHCPPYDSGLDMAPKLDETLKPIVKGGQIIYAPCGSTAVSNAVKKYQPLLGLHGHIHESRRTIVVGRTRCVNPGSEYTEGILRGALINLDEKGVKGYMLTSG